MPLNLRQMEVLRAVLRAKNLTGAGELLNISQPAVSRMLKHMESKIGFPLFERDRGRLLATPETVELAGELEKVFRNVSNTKRVAHALRQGWSSIIRIGAMPTLATRFLPDAIVTATRQHPKLKLVVKSLEPSPIETGIVSGDLSLGLVQTTAKAPELQAITLHTTQFVCLLPRNHRLAAAKVVAPADLAGETLISISEMTTHGSALDQAFGDAGVDRQVGVQTTSSALALKLVASGYGVALVDPFALDAVDADSVIARPLTPAVPVIAALWHRQGHVFSQPERALIAAIQAQVALWADRVEIPSCLSPH